VQPVYQDGFPPGTLQEFTIAIDGTIQGVFSNGLSRPMGRIALSLFANPAGLFRLGNNMWRVTDNSGLPQIGAPTTGGLGEINAGYLEQSNVDLGERVRRHDCHPARLPSEHAHRVRRGRTAGGCGEYEAVISVFALVF
jgi:flagellar hook-basal body protein